MNGTTINLDLHNLPDTSQVEAIIGQFDAETCAHHLYLWRNAVVKEGLETSPEQNRAMILVSRRIRALRETPKATGAKAKAKGNSKPTPTIADL